MHGHIGLLAEHITREELCVLPTPKPLWLSCLNIILEILQLQLGVGSYMIRGNIIPKCQKLHDCVNYIKGVGVQLFVVEVPIALSSLFGFVEYVERFTMAWFAQLQIHLHSHDTISLRNLRVLEFKGHGDLDQLFHRFYMPPLNLSVLNNDVMGTHPSTYSSNNHLIIKASRHFILYVFWKEQGRKCLEMLQVNGRFGQQHAINALVNNSWAVKNECQLACGRVYRKPNQH